MSRPWRIEYRGAWNHIETAQIRGALVSPRKKLYSSLIAPEVLAITALSDTKNERMWKNACEKDGGCCIHLLILLDFPLIFESGIITVPFRRNHLGSATFTSTL